MTEIRMGMRKCILLCVAVVFAAGSAGSTQPTADEVLAKVRKKYDSITDAELKFTQTVKFPVANVEQKVNGSLFVKKGNKYRVELDNQTIVTNGETVWSYSPSNNQVLIDKFTMDERSLSPEKILTGAPEDFTATLVGKETIGKTETVIVKLTPRSEQAIITSLRLWVNDGDGMIKQASLTDINGKETTYTVHQVRLNNGIPDSRFVFQIPEGAEVVDLR